MRNGQEKALCKAVLQFPMRGVTVFIGPPPSLQSLSVLLAVSDALFTDIRIQRDVFFPKES